MVSLVTCTTLYGKKKTTQMTFLPIRLSKRSNKKKSDQQIKQTNKKNRDAHSFFLELKVFSSEEIVIFSWKNSYITVIYYIAPFVLTIR